jgi:hypothetical protein
VHLSLPPSSTPVNYLSLIKWSPLSNSPLGLAPSLAQKY